MERTPLVRRPARREVRWLGAGVETMVNRGNERWGDAEDQGQRAGDRERQRSVQFQQYFDLAFRIEMRGDSRKGNTKPTLFPNCNGLCHRNVSNCGRTGRTPRRFHLKCVPSTLPPVSSLTFLFWPGNSLALELVHASCFPLLHFRYGLLRPPLCPFDPTVAANLPRHFTRSTSARPVDQLLTDQRTLPECADHQ
jgi:hypothetical protein